jgi:hypothetical protein
MPRAHRLPKIPPFAALEFNVELIAIKTYADILAQLESDNKSDGEDS